PPPASRSLVAVPKGTRVASPIKRPGGFGCRLLRSRRSSARRPPPPLRRGHRQHRPVGAAFAVLRVPLREEVPRAVRLPAFGEHLRRSSDPHPPEARPVLFVVIHEERRPRALAYVPQPSKVARAFGLVVDGAVEPDPLQREADRHQVRPPVGLAGREPRDPRPLHQPSHPRLVHGTSVVHSGSMKPPSSPIDGGPPREARVPPAANVSGASPA